MGTDVVGRRGKEADRTCELVRIAPLTSRAYGNFNRQCQGGLEELCSRTSSANSR